MKALKVTAKDIYRTFMVGQVTTVFLGETMKEWQEKILDVTGGELVDNGGEWVIQYEMGSVPVEIEVLYNVY